MAENYLSQVAKFVDLVIAKLKHHTILKSINSDLE